MARAETRPWGAFRLAASVALFVAPALFPHPVLASSGYAAALVVGINAYDHEKTLEGAVNDARSIANALQKVGTPNVTLLLDGEVTAERFRQAWRETLSRARSGDRIFLSYAGHGSQTPAVNPKSESDGLDEVLVLPHFHAGTKAGQREQIYDNEIALWLLDAKRKGVEVVAVFDSCHSGTITRDLAPGFGKARSREVPRYDRLIAPNEMSADERGVDDPESPPDNVLQFSAAQDGEAAIEVPIDEGGGKIAQHGALSFAIAKAIEGRADRNGDGVTTYGELMSFVRQAVKQYAESRHTPNFFPQDESRLNTPVFRSSASVAAPSAPAPPLRLAVRGGGPDAAAAALAGLPVTASDPGAADLVWTIPERTLHTALGELIAEGIGPGEVGSALGKWRLVARLKTLSLGGMLTTRILPNDRTHHVGAPLCVEIENERDAALILFNVTGHGEVQFLYPIDGDPQRIPVNRPWRLDLTVSRPVGAEHLVAVVLPEPDSRLVEDARAFDGTKRAEDLGELLAKRLVGKRYRLAVQGLYTGEKGAAIQ